MEGALGLEYPMDHTAMRACLHGGGGSQVGEVTRLGGVKN